MVRARKTLGRRPVCVLTTPTCHSKSCHREAGNHNGRRTAALTMQGKAPLLHLLSCIKREAVQGIQLRPLRKYSHTRASSLKRQPSGRRRKMPACTAATCVTSLALRPAAQRRGWGARDGSPPSQTAKREARCEVCGTGRWLLARAIVQAAANGCQECHKHTPRQQHICLHRQTMTAGLATFFFGVWGYMCAGRARPHPHERGHRSRNGSTAAAHTRLLYKAHLPLPDACPPAHPCTARASSPGPHGRLPRLPANGRSAGSTPTLHPIPWKPVQPRLICAHSTHPRMENILLGTRRSALLRPARLPARHACGRPSDCHQRTAHARPPSQPN